MHLAAKHGHCDVAALLLSRCQEQISIKDQLIGLTPLHLSSENNQPTMVQMLISQGADVASQDKV